MFGKGLAAAEGCRGDLCEKRLGAAPCWTQPAPVSSPPDTPQDIAEPAKEFGLSLKTYLGTGRKHWTNRGGGGGGGVLKRVRNNRRNTSVRGGGSSAARGEDHTRAARYSCRNRNPGRAHTGTGFFLKNCSPQRTHIGAGEKCEVEGAAERSCYIDCYLHSPSSLQCSVGP